MPLYFTIKDLKNQCGNTVFNRGLQYFEDGAISEIKTVVDKYTAKAYGRNVYTVAYSPEENAFSCNCPYDGFCKHQVAFGLKLLDEKEELPSTQGFENWFKNISAELKLNFLKQVVRKDIALREKLDRMSRQDDEPVEIDDIAEAVYNSMDELSYDDVWESRYNYNYYVDEFDVMDDLIQDTLEAYLSEVEERIQTGKLDLAFEYILGIYTGLKRSSETEIAEYFDDFENFLFRPLSQFTESLKQQPDKFKLKILNRFIDYCEKYPVDNFYLFKGFLLMFATEKDSDRLKKFLIPYTADYTAKEILMKIAEPDRDIRLMEKVLKNDAPASLYIPYLNILKANGEFEKIRQIVLKFSGHRDICELEQFIIPEPADETYKNLLLKLIEKCFKLKHYKNYKKLISEDENQEFLTKLKNNLSYSTENNALPVLFYGKIYDPVLKYIESRSDSEYGFDSYEKYLKEISKTMPGRVWEIYFKRVDHLFSERKRYAYHLMATYLKIMKKIDQEKTGQLITAYYNRKPRLPALKDEFNKAKII